MFALQTPSLQRTQIYLSADQHSSLGLQAREQSTTASALIRQAIDAYLMTRPVQSKAERRKQAAGAWGKNADAPSLKELRSEERSF